MGAALMHTMMAHAPLTDPGFPIGNAAWVYDTKGGAAGMWADSIGSFNSNATACAKVATVYSYGGDMEWYSPAGQVYFSDQSQQAAAKYAAAPGVDRVIAVVDGRMDGGEDWSPDLSKRTKAEVEAWADTTATVYC